MEINSRRDGLTQCYLLHSRAYKETSLLVELFSREYGRMALVARGARRSRSPLQAVLQPFRALLVSWIGRGEMRTLRTAEPDGVPLVLRGSPLASGFYLNELVLRLLYCHDPYPTIFECYTDTLAVLANPSASISPALRVFEKRILEAIGYGLILHTVADTGEPVRLDRNYGFNPEVGVLDHPTRSGSVSGTTLLALKQERFCDSLMQPDARNFMRAMIAYRIGHRPIASRALLQENPRRL